MPYWNWTGAFRECGGESVLKRLWKHQDAILCCSLEVNKQTLQVRTKWISVLCGCPLSNVIYFVGLQSLPPVFMFANQAGLDMLEITLVALQDITLDQILGDSARKFFSTDFSSLMHQISYYILPFSSLSCSTWYGWLCLCLHKENLRWLSISRLISNVMMLTELNTYLFSVGLCLHSCWNLHVDNGATCILWTSRCMESSYRGRVYCTLSCLLLRQLVILVILFPVHLLKIIQQS